MTNSNLEKKLADQPLAEQFPDPKRLQELEADPTRPWVKRYIRSLMEEHERLAREHDT